MNTYKILFPALLFILLLPAAHAQSSFDITMDNLMQGAKQRLEEMERRNKELQDRVINGQGSNTKVYSYSSGNRGNWIDQGKEMVLVVTLGINKGLTTDISIEDSIITITNRSEANSSINYSSTKRFRIPRNLNSESPKYKTEGNKLYISFLKI